MRQSGVEIKLHFSSIFLVNEIIFTWSLLYNFKYSNLSVYVLRYVWVLLSLSIIIRHASESPNLLPISSSYPFLLFPYYPSPFSLFPFLCARSARQDVKGLSKLTGFHTLTFRACKTELRISGIYYFKVQELTDRTT